MLSPDVVIFPAGNSSEISSLTQNSTKHAN